MSYTLDNIVALINRKEPLPSPFLKALKGVKSSACHLGIHKIDFKTLCSDLDLKLEPGDFDEESFLVNCDYLYKLVSVLLRHEVAMVPIGVPRNLSIYNQVYLTSRADILADSDIYQLQTLRGQKKTKYTNNEIEVIIRAKKKIQNFNTILHVFECLGAAKTGPLDTNQRIALNGIINDMLLPRDAERYVRCLFSYASELGSFNYDFTNGKYVSVPNAQWGEEDINQTIDLVARIMAPSHLAINVPHDFPHAQLLKERFYHYCPVVFDAPEVSNEVNIIPVNERALSSLSFNQRRSRLKKDIDDLLEQYHATTDSNEIMPLCAQSKNDILQSRPGYSSDLIRRLALLPKEYGNLSDYIAKLQSKLISDESSRLLVPNFSKTMLVLYTQDDEATKVTPTTITNSLLNSYCSNSNLLSDGDPIAALPQVPVKLDSIDIDHEERLSYVKATEAAIEQTISSLDKEVARPKKVSYEPKNSLAKAYSKIYSGMIEDDEGECELSLRPSVKDSDKLLVNPTDFSSHKNLKDYRGKYKSHQGVVCDDTFHVVPYTFDRLNFLMHSYLVWADDEQQVVNEPNKVRPCVNHDYGSNLEYFIKQPLKQLSRFNRMVNYEFLLRKLFGSAHNSSALSALGRSDEQDVERFFEMVSHNDQMLHNLNPLPLVLYHGLYYFDRYLQNPRTHFNNELFYVAVFKKEPYALNLYLARIFHKYGSRLIDVPEEFYTLFALNLILFPQKDFATISSYIARDLMSSNDKGSNLYKVVLLRSIAHDLYQTVQQNHKDSLSMELITHDEVQRRSTWRELNSQILKSQKIISSLIGDKYFAHVCPQDTFELSLSHLVDRKGYFDETAIKYSAPIKDILESFYARTNEATSEALLTILSTMEQILGFIDELKDEVVSYLKAHPSVYAKEPKPQDLDVDKDKLKEDLQDLDVKTNTPIFKPNRRKSSELKDKLKRSFDSEEQEREDILEDYAERFSYESKKVNLVDDEGGRWQAPSNNTKVKALSASDVVAKLMALKQGSTKKKDRPGLAFSTFSAPVKDVSPREDEIETIEADSKLMELVDNLVAQFIAKRKIKLQSNNLIKQLCVFLERRDHIKGIDVQFDHDLKVLLLRLQPYVDHKGNTPIVIEKLDRDLVHRVNLYFMLYACMSLARVLTLASGYGHIMDKSPLQMQELNNYYNLDWSKIFGRGTPFTDEIAQNLYDAYVVPLLKKVLCNNHSYFYSFNHAVDFNKRLENIDNLVRKDYLKAFVLSGLPFNRFVVDCACACTYGNKIQLDKMRSLALKVKDASHIGFPHGIAIDRLYELSGLLNHTIGVQIVPYYFENTNSANFTALRAVAQRISMLNIPEYYGFQAAALGFNELPEVKNEAYEDLLFSMYCGYVVLEILSALKVLANESGLLKLLTHELLSFHHLQSDEPHIKFVNEYLRECIRFIKVQGPIEPNLLLEPKGSLMTMILSSRGSERLKKLLIFSFGYELKQSYIGMEVKKQFACVLKNLKIINYQVPNNNVPNNNKGTSYQSSKSYQGASYVPNYISRVKNQQLNLDMNKIKAKLKESEQVQEVITELRDKEQMLQEQELLENLTNINNSSELSGGEDNNSAISALNSESDNSAHVNPETNDKGESQEQSDLAKLDVKVRNVISSLAVQGTDAMVYSEFNGICVSHGLISGNYCIEVLNEYAFEKYDEPVLELDGTDDSAIVYITTDLLEDMNNSLAQL